MPSARAIELHIGNAHAGHARLEIVSEDRSGDRFVIEVEGPAQEVRAEAEFLAAQYHLETCHDLRAGALVAI
jgi:hypothetical protein